MIVKKPTTIGAVIGVASMAIYAGLAYRSDKLAQDNVLLVFATSFGLYLALDLFLVLTRKADDNFLGQMKPYHGTMIGGTVLLMIFGLGKLLPLFFGVL